MRSVAGRTLDDIEQNQWAPPPPEATYLVKRCHELRSKPVDDFSVEDLRLLIGQRIGLATLVPLAIAALEDDPLAQGDFYPGDLLGVVLRLPQTFWTQYSALRRRMAEVVDRLDVDSLGVSEELAIFLRNA
jgi:hypothetical protein